MRASFVIVAALAVVASACSGVQESISDLRDTASGAAERSQFCFALTRALASLDGGSTPEEARAAAEEVLTQVPDELRDDAELVADRLETAAEEGDHSVLDDTFRDAAERLWDDTRAMCDPTR